MDNTTLISNILNYCAAAEKKPTVACTEAGVGKSFFKRHHACGIIVLSF